MPINRRPKRTQFLPFALPDLDEREMSAVQEVIQTGWLTTGPKTRAFEKAFADYVGARHAVAVNSATAALHLALEAAGMKATDEIITTTMTFAATAEVIRYFGAKPVLVDVEPEFLTIDANLIESQIGPQTRAIIPVHYGGQAANLSHIRELAERHNLTIIEDAAHALPVDYKGQRIGSSGDFTAFSFYATKTLATGEGGMLTTNNDSWAERCRMMSLHGISKDAWKRYTSSGSWYYEIQEPGFKYNMTDLAAALGLVQLSKVDQMTARRQAIALRYDSAFSQHPVLCVPNRSAESTHCYHLYPLRLNLDAITIDRNTFIERLREYNIGVSVHWMPLHMHPYYVRTYGYRPHDFPVAYNAFQCLISLPIYSAMSDDDIEDVVSAVLDIANGYLR